MQDYMHPINHLDLGGIDDEGADGREASGPESTALT
jgi:hypothetical protein